MEDLAEETKTLKKEELAKGLATLFTMKQKNKQRKLICGKKELHPERRRRINKTEQEENTG